MSTTSTDPGNKSVAEIEAEVDRERARVAETMSALQSKVSLRALVDEAGQAFYEHGGDISRTLGRQVRDNPLAAILAGVSLAWLMSGTGGPQLSDHRVARVGHGRTGAGDDLSYPDYGDDDSPGLRERAADWGGKMSDAASEAIDSTRASLEGAWDSVSGSGDDVRKAGRLARDWSSRHAHEVRSGVSAGMDDNPLLFGGIAFALGAALAAGLPRTQTEDELIGAQSDRLKGKVADLAARETEKAKSVAAAVMDEGKQMVGEAADALSKRTPDADTAAERTREAVRDAGGRLKDAAEAEADRTKLGNPDSPN